SRLPASRAAASRFRTNRSYRSRTRGFGRLWTRCHPERSEGPVWQGGAPHALTDPSLTLRMTKEPETSKHRASIRRLQDRHEAPRRGGMARVANHRRGVADVPVHYGAAQLRRVGGVDDRRVDVSALERGERGAHVLGRDHLRLDHAPQADALQVLP